MPPFFRHSGSISEYVRSMHGHQPNNKINESAAHFGPVLPLKLNDIHFTKQRPALTSFYGKVSKLRKVNIGSWQKNYNNHNHNIKIIVNNNKQNIVGQQNHLV